MTQFALPGLGSHRCYLIMPRMAHSSRTPWQIRQPLSSAKGPIRQISGRLSRDLAEEGTAVAAIELSSRESQQQQQPRRAIHPLMTMGPLAMDNGMQFSQALPVDLGSCWVQAQWIWNRRLNQPREAECTANTANTSLALRVGEQGAAKAALNSCSKGAPLVLDLQGKLELLPLESLFILH